jgi:ABC-2 type transport system ATP-binding protein
LAPDVLVLKGVTKRFGEQTAVDHLDVAVRAGCVFGLLGPNGSGKTTTIRMILGILQPDEGSIKVFGERLREATKRRIGYLPEERGLYRQMRVLDHLVFLGRLKGMPGGAARERARAWLERFQLAETATKRVEELSKGMQQKVQFIGTLLHDPELVILDEPFSGLDPVATQEMKEVMLELRQRGRTILFSTHQMEQVERSCDEILLIHRGRRVLGGPTSEIRARYGQPTVKVAFDGDLGDLASWEGIESLENDGRYAEIRLRDMRRTGELLRELVRRVEVRRFEVSEASLEEIFIQQVKGSG